MTLIPRTASALPRAPRQVSAMALTQSTKMVLGGVGEDGQPPRTSMMLEGQVGPPLAPRALPIATFFCAAVVHIICILVLGAL